MIICLFNFSIGLIKLVSKCYVVLLVNISGILIETLLSLHLILQELAKFPSNSL